MRIALGLEKEADFDDEDPSKRFTKMELEALKNTIKGGE